jgi:hypothetical protein
MHIGNDQIREIGVSQARGITAYFSLDQTRTFSTYRREGSGVIRNNTIDELFQKRRDAGDDRFFVAILEGSLGFLQSYQASLTIPRLVVYISTPEVLRALNVEVIDENWRSNRKKIDLNNYLPT